jgi:hypothetical protein
MPAGQPWFETVVLTDEEERKVVALEDAVAAAVWVRAAGFLSPRRRCLSGAAALMLTCMSHVCRDVMLPAAALEQGRV